MPESPEPPLQQVVAQEAVTFEHNEYRNQLDRQRRLARGAFGEERVATEREEAEALAAKQAEETAAPDGVRKAAVEAL